MADTNIEGVSSPVSDTTKQVLESLKAEGHEIEENRPAQFGDDEQVIETEIEAKKEEPTPEPAPEVKPEEKQAKPEREHSFVPAWKLKVAEDQKAKAEARHQEALAEIERLSRKTEMTHSEKQDLSDEISSLADEYGVDKGFLSRLEKSILAKSSTPKEITEKLKELDVIKAEINKKHEETAYSQEFDKDIIPLIRAENPEISESALSQIKDILKTYAYSEEYGKLPLSKIYKAEREGLPIPAPAPRKKSAESSRSGTIRANDDIDFDNMTEEQFKNLPGEKMLEFARYKAGRK